MIGKKNVSIALDGPSGAGKSTVARAIAKRLGFVYVDTGAIYRTVGLAVKRAGLSAEDAEGIAALLPDIHLDLTYRETGEQAVLLNGEDVSGLIRTPEISRYASGVSAQVAVRAFLLQMQRDMAESHDVVMDGRDIGTVVLPSADVKIFLTAALESRARRRWMELQERGDRRPYEEVLREMRERDTQDERRAVSPLKRAEDAVLLDTSDLDFEESVTAACRIIGEKTGL